MKLSLHSLHPKYRRNTDTPQGGAHCDLDLHEIVNMTLSLQLVFISHRNS